MRVRLQLTFATVLAAMPLMVSDSQKAAAAPSRTLVFEGTVVSIATVAHDFKPWLITVKVTKVVSGEFAGSTFEFLVHSPARSGLEKGPSYTIEAVWKDDGYIVDENQWRRRKRSQIGTRSAVPG